MEVSESVATLSAMACDGGSFRVVLDMCDRHFIRGVFIAALVPLLAQVLVLRQDCDVLDHQERDCRINTIWGFHQHFDAPTLLSMTEASLIFVEPDCCPSQIYTWA
jgi:hypothetical protein